VSHLFWHIYEAASSRQAAGCYFPLLFILMMINCFWLLHFMTIYLSIYYYDVMVRLVLLGAERSRRLRSPANIHQNKSGLASSSSTAPVTSSASSASKEGGRESANNSRFSFLKGKGFKGIFQ
jgi:hypothetical protein